MNFNHTIKQLIAKADPSQASKLEEFLEIEKPNSIQIATLNEIKLAISKYEKKSQIINELKNKITNRGLSLLKNTSAYPEEKFVRLVEILENQTFEENQLEFKNLSDFIIPEENSIFDLLEKLLTKNTLDLNEIKIQDFNSFTLEDFQEEKIQNPKPLVYKPKIKITEVKTDTQAEQNQTQKLDEQNTQKGFLNKLYKFCIRFKNSLFITLFLAVYYSYFKTNNSNSNQEKPASVQIQKITNTPTCNLIDISKTKSVPNLNPKPINLKSYIENCNFPTHQNTNHPKALQIALNMIQKQIQDIQNNSYLPIEFNLNLIDTTTKETGFTYSFSTPRSSTNPHLKNPTNNLKHLYNIDVTGISFKDEEQNQNNFLIEGLVIHKPVLIESTN